MAVETAEICDFSPPPATASTGTPPVGVPTGHPNRGKTLAVVGRLRIGAAAATILATLAC